MEFEGQIRKVQLLPTQDCEAGYGPADPDSDPNLNCNPNLFPNPDPNPKPNPNSVEQTNLFFFFLIRTREW